MVFVLSLIEPLPFSAQQDIYHNIDKTICYVPNVILPSTHTHQFHIVILTPSSSLSTITTIYAFSFQAIYVV